MASLRAFVGGGVNCVGFEVNNYRVGKGKIVPINPGDEIQILPVTKVLGAAFKAGRLIYRRIYRRVGTPRGV